ncbi:MAG: LON peptidase substrate-binding domain-containing protein, partial [Myxococcota bacterium]
MPEKEAAVEKTGIGILPVRNTVLFPEVTVPLLVGREKSKRLVEALSKNETPVLGIIAQRVAEMDDPAIADLYGVGVTGRLLKVTKVSDDNLQLVIQGEHRFRVVAPGEPEPYLTATIELIEEAVEKDFELEAL